MDWNDPIKMVNDLFFPFDIGEVYCSFVSLIIKPWPSGQKLKYKAISWYSPSFSVWVLIFVKVQTVWGECWWVQHCGLGPHMSWLDLQGRTSCHNLKLCPNSNGMCCKCLLLVTQGSRWQCAFYPPPWTPNTKACDSDSEVQHCMWWEHVYVMGIFSWLSRAQMRLM